MRGTAAGAGTVVERPSAAGDEADLLRRVCHAFASTTDADQAVEATIGWVREALVGAPSTIGVLLPDAAGRLRVTATEGSQVQEGRLRSSRRRRAFETKRSIQVDLRTPAGRTLHIQPLVCRGEVVGVLEVVAPRSVIEQRRDVLEAVVGQAAAVLRNARERREWDRALRGLRASVDLASELFLVRSVQGAVRIAVNLCREHLRVPVLGWVPSAGDEGTVVIRGLGSAKRAAVRDALAGLVPSAPAERASGAARVLEPIVGTELAVVRAGDALLVAAGHLGEPGMLLLETVGQVLGEALKTIGILSEARARSDGLDVGIAWTVHELRGPLIGARAAIDHVLSRGGVEPSDRLLRGTRDELDRLASLVDPLLRWAVGSGRLSKRRTDLVEIVRQAVASSSLQMGEQRVAVFAPATLELRADPKQLRTAVANLLRNALTYSPAGSKVIVEVGRKDGIAWVCVRDRGPGVPREEQELIFDPFARGAARSGSRSGTGLGLFIARRVVEAHGGTVRLLPSRRGAALCLELPTAERGVRSAS